MGLDRGAASVSGWFELIIPVQLTSQLILTTDHAPKKGAVHI